MSQNSPDAILEHGHEHDFDGIDHELGSATSGAVLPSLGDQVSDFIHRQPLLTMSLAFGLGLLATSLLARRAS
jgi:hypothetical protein